jgi:radical SAM superfamily enzyme YgiQ (UPF0313 family)
MKVFLGNAPWSKPGFYGVRAGSRWPHFEDERLEYMPFPFFLAYAAAVLEEAGREVLLVDGIAEHLDEDQFVARIEKFGPRLVVLEVSTQSIEADLTLAARLKKLFGRDLRIAFCGLHQFMYAPEFLQEHAAIDFILVGEYDHTLRELVALLDAGADLAACRGLIYRNGGGVAATERRDVIEDLDTLPWPARHFLPMTNYHDEPGNIPRPSVQMWSSRGCPFGCIFCAWPQIMYGNNRYRRRSVAGTVDEMEWLVREMGFQSVYFDDDTFNVGKKRTIAFAREVRARRLGVPWAIMARADAMDREMLEALKEAGLHAVKYGVESATQEILDQCGKGLSVEKVRRAVAITHELGIKMHLTFMFGLPGETAETARRTIDLALELAPESVQFTISTPFPGSRYYHQLEREGRLLTKDFSRYDGFRSAVIRTESLSASELEEICREANDVWNAFWWERKHPDRRTNTEKVRDLIREPGRIPRSVGNLVKGNGRPRGE